MVIMVIPCMQMKPKELEIQLIIIQPSKVSISLGDQTVEYNF